MTVIITTINYLPYFLISHFLNTTRWSIYHVQSDILLRMLPELFFIKKPY